MPGVETPKTGEYVHVRVRDPGDFEDGTMRTVSITSGIKSVMGKLKGGDGSMVVQNWMFDKDKYTEAEARAWIEKHKSKSASELIAMFADRFEYVSLAPLLSEDGTVAKGEVLRTGSWIYKGDAMDITREQLVQALENHRKHKRDVMLDYNHGSRIGRTPEEQKRAGDLLDLELVDADGVTSLVGTFKPTEEAAAYIGKDEYKYLSAEFDQDYFHPEDKKPIGFYLQAVALTNRPFIEGMAPMVLMSETATALLAQNGSAYTGSVSMQYECDEKHDVGDMLTKMIGTMKDAGMKVTGSSASKYKNSPSVAMYAERRAQEDKKDTEPAKEPVVRSIRPYRGGFDIRVETPNA